MSQDQTTYQNGALSAVMRKRLKKQTEETNYTCTYPGCNFASFNKTILNNHIRTHTGEKPYTCAHPGCNYATATRHQLLRHMIIHLEGRHFICPHSDCTYATRTQRALNDHMIEHETAKRSILTLLFAQHQRTGIHSSAKLLPPQNYRDLYELLNKNLTHQSEQ